MRDYIELCNLPLLKLLPKHLAKSTRLRKYAAQPNEHHQTLRRHGHAARRRLCAAKTRPCRQARPPLHLAIAPARAAATLAAEVASVAAAEEVSAAAARSWEFRRHAEQHQRAAPHASRPHP
jgi:hypothetical protein